MTNDSPILSPDNRLSDASSETAQNNDNVLDYPASILPLSLLWIGSDTKLMQNKGWKWPLLCNDYRCFTTLINDVYRNPKHSTNKHSGTQNRPRRNFLILWRWWLMNFVCLLWLFYDKYNVSTWKPWLYGSLENPSHSVTLATLRPKLFHNFDKVCKKTSKKQKKSFSWKYLNIIEWSNETWIMLLHESLRIYRVLHLKLAVTKWLA